MTTISKNYHLDAVRRSGDRYEVTDSEGQGHAFPRSYLLNPGLYHDFVMLTIFQDAQPMPSPLVWLQLLERAGL